ncbi:hypothetical protein EJ07DRAFT_170687 [Lizonia empirigonia]|nr:hypothetical protein EJ07DRAFT_170687 [Lizonia empirigonia]
MRIKNSTLHHTLNRTRTTHQTRAKPTPMTKDHFTHNIMHIREARRSKANCRTPHLTNILTPRRHHSPTKPHLLSQRNDFLLDWALKILGVASAILFGIWAPISYKIMADGNAGNDAAQASLMSEMSSMRDEAATAASAQRDVVSALANVQHRLDNVGLIWAWDFCSGREDPVCTEISSSAKILQALSSLGGLTGDVASSPTGTPISTGTPSPTGAPASDSAVENVSSKDLLAIILGSIFGGIVVIGLIVGILAKKRPQRKLLEESHS